MNRESSSRCSDSSHTAANNSRGISLNQRPANNQSTTTDDFFLGDTGSCSGDSISSRLSTPSNKKFQSNEENAVPVNFHNKDKKNYGTLSDERRRSRQKKHFHSNRQPHFIGKRRFLWIHQAAQQLPAVALVGMFHLMVGIPFGVSYFPVGWRATTQHGDEGDDTSADDVHGEFPIGGKEALGIRMFLFSTVVSQIVFTFASKFANPIGLQMVENVPFCHALAYVVINEQGYGMEALSTLFFLFGISSVIVGVVFYLLGRLSLGKVVYFFPSHVLVGCIGGIGVFIFITGIEVTMDATFSLNSEGIHQVLSSTHLLGVVVLFEVALRIFSQVTKADGKAQYPLLTPIYFCLITPIFYAALWLLHVDVDEAKDAGYFFPSLDECDLDTASDHHCEDQSTIQSIFNEDLWIIWKVVNFSTISWAAVFKSIPTMVALTAFSLIHVPINIPAFAISTNADADMNAELIAHGYSNFIVGVVGGLQNYMAYTQSILYAKSGGQGKASSLSVAAVTVLFFFVGPTIASFIPRCMAGTLLVHVGIDLFLEGVYDSYGRFDRIEYAGIWLIAGVMTIYGMSAALIAGVISALTTYAVQSIAHLQPIRGHMSASTLTSSSWNRRNEANAILDDDEIGRNRILVIQMQGHLFFGNVAELADDIKAILAEKHGTQEEPWIVILDFTLVLGLDSSAAQIITKLKRTMHKMYNVDTSIFVSGSSDGFPTEYPLSSELSREDLSSHALDEDDYDDLYHDGIENEVNRDEGDLLLRTPRRSFVEDRNPSFTLATGSVSIRGDQIIPAFPANHVCNTLDSALTFAEDILICRKDPGLLDDNIVIPAEIEALGCLVQEQEVGVQYLKNMCPGQNEEDVKYLFSLFQREVYRRDDIVWKQGSPGDSLKLLVFGTLFSSLEREAGTTEPIATGNMIGELALVNRTKRMSTVICNSNEAIVYSLDLEVWDQLTKDNPKVARFIDLIVVRYLAQRVCHVSNRIFETRCLPV